MSVLLPGAAFPEFALEKFEIVIDRDEDDENTLSLSFAVATKEVARKQGRKQADDDEEEEEEDEDKPDWESKSAWENYGPGFSIEPDFGALKVPLKQLRAKLPITLKIDDKKEGGDDEEEDEGEEAERLHCYCMDHQDLRGHVIKFSKRVKSSVILVEWASSVICDEKEDEPHPVTLSGEATIKVDDEDLKKQLFGGAL